MIGIIVLSFYTNSALADTQGPQDACRIKLGGGGNSSPWLTIKGGEVTRLNDIGGPWDFIRETAGKCDFTLFNKNNFKGRRATYGTGIKNRLRVGAKGGIDKNGWKVRSLIINPRNSACSIELQEDEKLGGRSSFSVDRRQTFYGPGKHRDITGWSSIQKVKGPCTFMVFSSTGLGGYAFNATNLPHLTRVGFRIRSIKMEDPRGPAPSLKEIKHTNGRCLDVAGGVRKDGTNVQIYQCNNSISQKWRWGSKGEIMNGNRLCLDISGIDVTNGSNIEIFKCNGSRTQKWERLHGNRIKNSLGFCLDIANGLDANKTNVQLYKCTNGDAQKWQY